jgi:hypothetical protein
MRAISFIHRHRFVDALLLAPAEVGDLDAEAWYQS